MLSARWARAILNSQIDPFALFEPVRDAAGTIVDLAFVDVSAAGHAAWEAIARGSDRRLVGTRLTEFDPALGEHELFTELVRTVETGEPWVADDVAVTLPGTAATVWFDIRAVRLGDHLALTSREATTRHLTGAALAASERKLRLLLEHMDDVVLQGVGSIARWVSPSITNLLGVNPEEVVGRPSAGLWHPDDLPTAVALSARVERGEPARGVLRMRHRDGHHVWVEAALSQYVDENGDMVGVTALRDVTAQVLAEQALERRSREYRLLAENAADVVFRTRPGRGMDWVSPSCESVIGWRVEDLLGHLAVELLHPDDAPVLHRTRLALREGRAITFEARVRRPDGTSNWFSITLRPILDEAGELTEVVGGARSVQQEVEARQARHHADSLLATALRSAAMGMAIIDLEGRFQMVNPALGRMVRREEAWLLAHSTADLLHPEDSEEIGSDVLAMLADEGDTQVRQLRLTRADGGIVWVRRTAVLIREAAGEPRSVLLQLEDVTAEHEAHERLAYQAFHDSLTGLHNRAWILDMLDAELRAARRDGSSVGVLFIDLDNFKVVNDSLGHAAGDELLAAVARGIASVLRPMDHVGRFGGDEFIVVVPSISEPIDAERVAVRVAEVIGADATIQGHRVVPSASIGIALSTPSSTASGLLRDADSALFRAKGAGRARWRFFDEQMHAQAVSRLTIENELREAVEQRRFTVRYQPVVRFADGAVIGHEALVRWQHPARGLLEAAEFLAVAEETGLVVPIGEQVLAQVCALLGSRPDLPGPVAINVSGVQLNRADWREGLVGSLARHGVDPRRLVVEVTESALLAGSERSRQDLVALREAGVRIYLDDFGTGFASISTLCDLPVSGLKLDARFVHALANEATARALASALAHLAEELGIGGIAEGVETAEQAQALVAMGWRLGQGNLFGEPAPIPAVAAAQVPAQPSPNHGVTTTPVRPASGSGAACGTP